MHLGHWLLWQPKKPHPLLFVSPSPLGVKNYLRNRTFATPVEVPFRCKNQDKRTKWIVAFLLAHRFLHNVR
jgi:hypothetical protein